MADADFNIKVVTAADISGLQQTDAALAKIEARRLSLNKAFLAPIPVGLTGQQTLPVPPPAELEKANELTGRLAHGFERIAIHAAGIGVVLGAINSIKEMAAEINKITESLDKQGESLVENSRQLILQSKFAKDDADILKISEQALKNIVEQHKTVEELQKKELSNWEKIQDAAVVGPTLGANPNQARLDQQRAQASSSELASKRIGIEAIVSAIREKERISISSLTEQEDNLNDKIKEQQDLQQKHYIDGDIKGYVEAGKAIELYKKLLEDVVKLEKAHQKAIEDKQKAIKEADKRATNLEAKAAAAAGKPNQSPEDQAAAQAAAQEASAARAEAQRQEAELREQQRAEARKKSDFDEVKKYGRVLDPQERAQETIKEREELGQKAGQAQEKERQKALEDQMQQQLRGITPEQQRNEREALGVKPPEEKDTSQGIIRAIEQLNQKFDRYWQ